MQKNYRHRSSKYRIQKIYIVQKIQPPSPNIKTKWKWADTINAIIASCAIGALVFSIVTYSKINMTIVRDDAMENLKNVEFYYLSSEYEQAIDCLSSAIMYNNAIAQIYLGYIYSNGLGCDQDIDKGTAYYQHAKRLGYPFADEYLFYNSIFSANCIVDIAKLFYESIHEGSNLVSAHLYSSILFMSYSESVAAQEFGVPIKKDISEYSIDEIAHLLAYTIEFDRPPYIVDTAFASAGIPDIGCYEHNICINNSLITYEYAGVISVRAEVTPYMSFEKYRYKIWHQEHFYRDVPKLFSTPTQKQGSR